MAKKAKKPEKFYIGIAKKGDKPIGQVVSVGKPVLFEDAKAAPALPGQPKAKEKKASQGDTSSPADPFQDVFDGFVASMETYRQFISLSLTLVSDISNIMIERQIFQFVTKRGVKKEALSSDTTTIYELEMSCFRDYRLIETRSESARSGADHLPEVMIIGLIAVFDAFLAKVIRTFLDKHGGVVLKSLKTITYADLLAYTSIDDAKNAMLDEVVEDILRTSHQQQIDWIETRLKVEIRKDLPIWPSFIELCERRNLMTHTRGIISSQYLNVCKEHKSACGDVKLGDKLTVDAKYFEKAVGIVYEMGVRICSTLWRKSDKSVSEAVDQALNQLSFDLISDRAYQIAETILRYATNVPKHKPKEMLRRMMIVNLANSVRLQQRQEEANTILDEEDWSASDKEFLISVAAVKGDVKRVVKLMGELRTLGTFPAHQYRDWPVFRGLHSNELFMKAFESAHGEPLNLPATTTIQPPKQPENPVTN